VQQAGLNWFAIPTDQSLLAEARRRAHLHAPSFTPPKLTAEVPSPLSPQRRT